MPFQKVTFSYFNCYCFEDDVKPLFDIQAKENWNEKLMLVVDFISYDAKHSPQHKEKFYHQVFVWNCPFNVPKTIDWVVSINSSLEHYRVPLSKCKSQLYFEMVKVFLQFYFLQRCFEWNVCKGNMICCLNYLGDENQTECDIFRWPRWIEKFWSFCSILYSL